MTTETNRNRELRYVERVDTLSEEVRVLALNLAIYLVKAKVRSAELNRLEPDFVRLINGAVNVVQEIGRIINAARNIETLTYDVPSGRISQDQIEIKLLSILDQCGRVLTTLSQTRDIKA